MGTKETAGEHKPIPISIMLSCIAYNHNTMPLFYEVLPGNRTARYDFHQIEFDISPHARILYLTHATHEKTREATYGDRNIKQKESK